MIPFLLASVGLILAFVFQFIAVNAFVRGRVARDVAEFANNDPVGFDLWLSRARIAAKQTDVDRLFAEIGNASGAVIEYGAAHITAKNRVVCAAPRVVESNWAPIVARARSAAWRRASRVA